MKLQRLYFCWSSLGSINDVIEVMYGVFPHHVKQCANHVKIYGRHFEWNG